MISLRKINSILVIIIFLFILNHAILSVLYLYGLISYSPNFQITGRRLFYPIAAHLAISLYLYFSDKRKQDKIYSQLVKKTNQQIITGIGIVVFASLHILTYMFNPISSAGDFLIRLSHFIIDNMLFVSIAFHLRVSIPRLLVSFGFLDSKNAYKNAEKRINRIIIVILIIFILAEVIYYLGV